MKSVYVLAYITALPGKRSAVLRHILDVEPTVRAETGCIEYQATIDLTGDGGAPDQMGEDTFVVVEQWACLADLEAHRLSPHMADFGRRVKDLILKRVIHVTSAP